jgi:hypothetical protein
VNLNPSPKIRITYCTFLPAMLLQILLKKLNKNPESKPDAFRVVDVLNLFAILWSVANNFLLAFEVFGGPEISCAFMEVYYGAGTFVRVGIFTLVVYCNFVESCVNEATRLKMFRKYTKAVFKFNRLTMKAMITMMCYALLMIQGKCSDRSPLIVTFFVILITGTQVMVKVVAKYSSYIAVYRLKNMCTFAIVAFTFIQFVSFYTEPDMPALNLLYFIAVCDFYAECADVCRSRCCAEDDEAKANEKLARELAKTGHSRNSIQVARAKSFHYDSDDDDDYDIEQNLKQTTLALEMNPMTLKSQSRFFRADNVQPAST